MAQDGPEEDEPKSERFNMFISKSEMEAIDEWAWKNRVRSKSEAVRRLCQIGLAFDAVADDVVATVVEDDDRLMKAFETLNELAGSSLKTEARLIDAMSDIAGYTLEDARRRTNVLTRIRAIPALRERESFEAAFANHAALAASDADEQTKFTKHLRKVRTNLAKLREQTSEQED